MPIKHYHSSHQRRKKRRNLYILLASLITLAAAAGCFGYVWLRTSSAQQPDRMSVAAADSQLESSASSLPAENLPEESADMANTVLSEPESSEPESSAVQPQDEPALNYDFTQPVPETEPVEDSYFSDALFIGDSRTQGFILYSGLSNTTSYADRGLSVDKVFTDTVISENGGDYTVADALAHHQGEFNKVYLMFGINELGWSYPQIFQDRYREVVATVRESQPEAIIYVQSILPVSREKSTGSDIYNMERVNLFNGLLKELAAEEEVCYLDVSSGVADEEGYLPDDASTDGVHLNKTYCVKWLDYLKTHALASQPSGASEDAVASAEASVEEALEEAQQSAAQS